MVNSCKTTFKSSNARSHTHAHCPHARSTANYGASPNPHLHPPRSPTNLTRIHISGSQKVKLPTFSLGSLPRPAAELKHLQVSAKTATKEADHLVTSWRLVPESGILSRHVFVKSLDLWRFGEPCQANAPKVPSDRSRTWKILSRSTFEA